jgi:hypothetical protein
MSLRKSPKRTPALLAANRANSIKSTGPRTERGKARVALNPLRHGRRTVALQEKLRRAGYRDGEAVYCRIRSRLAKTFAAPGEDLNGQVDRLANWIWVFQRGLRCWASMRAKPEYPLECGDRTSRQSHHTRIVTNDNPVDNIPQFLPLLPATKICVNDYYMRIGIVFYAQQRRHSDRWETPGLSGSLEEGLRCRVFRRARPRMWERLRFCLDKQGRYHSEWEEEFRRVRAAWRGTEMEVWLQPHPILATLRQQAYAAFTCCSGAL